MGPLLDLELCTEPNLVTKQLHKKNVEQSARKNHMTIEDVIHTAACHNPKNPLACFLSCHHASQV